ncbi:MAG: arsenate reductase (glutaredoxin) [Gammaproteobacteria bacterium]|nr:arsenate reductase (glutaredoxin) [Gammaproteobacteria bacterium]
MATYTLYHNPRCSKSRQTLALLQENGIQPEIIEYLTSPPSLAALQQLQQLLGVAALQMLRTKEQVFAELGLGNYGLTDTQLLQAAAANPILLERPIVVCGDRAVIGRPPENALELL